MFARRAAVEVGLCVFDLVSQPNILSSCDFSRKTFQVSIPTVSSFCLYSECRCGSNCDRLLGSAPEASNSLPSPNAILFSSLLAKVIVSCGECHQNWGATHAHTHTHKQSQTRGTSQRCLQIGSWMNFVSLEICLQQF